jgi:hypothetical protein
VHGGRGERRPRNQRQLSFVLRAITYALLFKLGQAILGLFKRDFLLAQSNDYPGLSDSLTYIWKVAEDR